MSFSKYFLFYQSVVLSKCVKMIRLRLGQGHYHNFKDYDICRFSLLFSNL